MKGSAPVSFPNVSYFLSQKPSKAMLVMPTEERQIDIVLYEPATVR